MSASAHTQAASPSSNAELFEIYQAVHTQGFMPIFVKDPFDTPTLVEGCVKAGMKAIEYTLRREDCRQAIPWIRKQYPDLKIIVGSTIDNDDFVVQHRRWFPQLMTLDELADLGVHGFVSQLPWRDATIAKWSRTHLVCPHAADITDAYLQLCAGAQMVKLTGTDLGPVRKAMAPATFGLIPILVTGGQTLEQIPESINAGAVAIASGCDLLFKGVDPASLTVDQVAAAMSQFRHVTQNARHATYPNLIQKHGAEREAWLSSLPHVHPF